MPSLFNKTIDKSDAIKKIAEELKQLKLTANWYDVRWEVLNENKDTLIENISIEQTKTNYLLIIYYKTSTSYKINKTFIPLFEINAKQQLNRILTCDLSEFEKKTYKKNKKELDEESSSDESESNLDE